MLVHDVPSQEIFVSCLCVRPLGCFFGDARPVIALKKKGIYLSQRELGMFIVPQKPLSRSSRGGIISEETIVRPLRLVLRECHKKKNQSTPGVWH